MQPTAPFPNDLPIYPLKKLSLVKLQANDETENRRLFEACQRDGFFLLDLSGSPEQTDVLRGVDDAFDIAERFFSEPEEEKRKHLVNERAIGYKPLGYLKSKQKSEAGQGDIVELYTIDIASTLTPSSGHHDPTAADLPKTMLDNHAALANAATTLQDLGAQILTSIAHALHIKPELLTSLHSRDESSKTSLRLLHGPPQPDPDVRRWSFPGHQDHGSLTILFNRLGGLQVLNPDAPPTPDLSTVTDEAWLWIKPQPNCAIINLGNPFVRWTGGVLRSAYHRVLYPPGEQGDFDRYSFGLFIKPRDDASLSRFKGSDLIPANTPEEEEAERDLPAFADWHTRSVASLKLKEVDARA